MTQKFGAQTTLVDHTGSHAGKQSAKIWTAGGARDLVKRESAQTNRRVSLCITGVYSIRTMMLLSWLLEIIDNAMPCTGYGYSQKEEVQPEVDADDRTWCSTQWIGGMKHSLNDDVTLATKDDYTYVTKEDNTVATCPTDSMSEKS